MTPDRLTRPCQLESHAHARMLDAMAEPQRRAHRKARSARNAAVYTATALAFATLTALSGLWPFAVVALVAAVLAVAGFRRAVVLARPLDDDTVGEAIARYDAAVRDREAAELEPPQQHHDHSANRLMLDRVDREGREIRAARDRMARSLRRADAGEYARFLDKWTQAGRPLRHYDYPMPPDRVWVATGRLHLERLCGAYAFGVILVPPGIEVTGTEPVHTDVVWADLSRSVGFHGSPVRELPAYSDAYPAIA